MSTAMSDPAWYHEFQGPDHIFKDKRGILNGLRLRPIIVQSGHGECPCEEKDPTCCRAMADYKFNLSFVDFDKMMRGIETFCRDYAIKEKLEEEPIAVLMVYETPDNPCSERKVLIDYFNSHGIECKELEYPIQKLNLKV
jgi:hypothetical protein